MFMFDITSSTCFVHILVVLYHVYVNKFEQTQ